MGDNASYYPHPAEVVVQGEEEVDENYDPTDFLHSLGQPQDAETAQHQLPLQDAESAETVPHQLQQQEAVVAPFDVGEQVNHFFPTFYPLILTPL